MEKKNQQAQNINSIEEINNNPEPLIEITPTPTSIITEEDIKEEIKLIEETNTITMIEDIIEPNPEFEEDVADTPTTTAVPVIERPKNTVRYIDGGFTF
jgi:NADPH-dependent glutamate synthase beta subunit-like oxidoreductase